MPDAKTFVANAPAWVDLSSKDAAGSRDFYSRLFGWKVELTTDPTAGGYALAKLGGKDVAGIGPAQDPNAPSAWMVYIGSRDVDALAKKIEAAGGKVVAPPFDVLESGRMAVFQDPTGAFISAWQPKEMFGAEVMGKAGAYGWAEHGRFEEMHHALFKAHWEAGGKLEDIDDLVRIGSDVGLEAHDLRSAIVNDRYADVIDENRRLATSAGINAIPAHVFGRRFLVMGAQPYDVLKEVVDKLLDS